MLSSGSLLHGPPVAEVVSFYFLARVFVRVRSHMNGKLRSLIELLLEGFPEVSYPLRPPPTPLLEAMASDTSPSTPGSSSSSSSDVSGPSDPPSLVSNFSIRSPTSVYRRGPYLSLTEKKIFISLLRMHRLQKRVRHGGHYSLEELR